MNAIFYLQDIYWREPLWLLLSFQPVIIILLKKFIEKNNISLYVENKLQPWVVFPARYTLSKQIFSKNSAYLLAWLLFSIALAGPRTPLSQTDKEQFYGANIMLVVDLSRSMKAMDIKPNRLRRAKIEIYEFLEKAKDHRIGVTVFSARPHLFVPLTSDHAVLQTYIESLDKLSFPTMGSNPVDAILFAQNELKNIKGNSAIVLLSDGDFSEVSNEQIKQLKKENIPLYILGIGTPEGEAVPLKDGTWLKNEQQYVVSKMNVGILEYLAAQLNGMYSPLYDDNSDWAKLYDQGIARHNTATNIDGKQQILWDEAFSWFLIPSIFLFIFSLGSYRLHVSKNIVIFPLTCIILFSLTEKDVNALEIGQSNEQFAYRAYMKGDYSTAEKYYKNIANHRTYHSYLGQANSLYKIGHYQEAIQQFTFAILNAKSDSQRANALYNLANSYFRTGNFSLAINTYKDVLRYQPENKACLHNLSVSEVLKTNIEQRIKEEEKIISSARQGRGSQSSSVADGTEINENTSVSIGDDENTLDSNIPLPELPDINEDIVKKLILTGLKNIKLAEQSHVSTQYPGVQSSKNINLIQAQQQLNAISDLQHLLWKRLFEIEEGFPAPVEEPRIIPGVKPW